MKKITLYALIVLILGACSKQEQVFQTEQITFEETTYLTDEQQDSLHLLFTIELPTRMPSDSALQPIQSDIISKLVGERYAQLTLQDALVQYANMCETEYLNNNKMLAELALTEEFDSEEDTHIFFCEAQIYNARVERMQANILSYEIEQYIYTGGAHGVNNRFFYNYNATTGTLLNESDLFTPDYQEALTILLRQNFMIQHTDAQTEEDLYQSEYDIDKIIPNNNFYLTQTGLVYLFNPYEIAPYSYGATEVILSKELIEPLLQKDVILW